MLGGIMMFKESSARQWWGKLKLRGGTDPNTIIYQAAVQRVGALQLYLYPQHHHAGNLPLCDMALPLDQQPCPYSPGLSATNIIVNLVLCCY